MNHERTKKLVLLSLLSAIIVVLQVLIGGVAHIGPVSLSVVLIPIVVGAATCGTRAGLLLGSVFGFAVLIFDATSQWLWSINPFYTLLVVIAKGALAGWLAGLVYQLVKGKNSYVAALLSAIVCPTVNTAIFLLGMRVFFYPQLQEMAVGAGANVLYFAFVIIGVMNYLPELILNLFVSPAIPQIVKAAGFRKGEA